MIRMRESPSGGLAVRPISCAGFGTHACRYPYMGLAAGNCQQALRGANYKGEVLGACTLSRFCLRDRYHSVAHQRRG